MLTGYSNNKHPEFVSMVFKHALNNVFNYPDYQFRIMQRTAPVGNPRRLTLGYIDLRKKIICLDILTPKKRQPKSINSLLRTIAHEVAHIQKPPYRQRYQGRIITRQHYPEFYQQVTQNIELIKGDEYLRQFFRD